MNCYSFVKCRVSQFACLLVKGPKKMFLRYWEAYGGTKALIMSLYLWIAFILAVFVLLINWINNSDWDWQQRIFDTIPSVLGFSLGGYAILISFGDAEFKRRIREKRKDSNVSLYMRVNASFLHFIFVQFLCLVYTIITESLGIAWDFPFNFFGILIFLYAMLTVVATSFAVLRLAAWFDSLPPNEDSRKGKES